MILKVYGAQNWVQTRIKWMLYNNNKNIMREALSHLTSGFCQTFKEALGLLPLRTTGLKCSSTSAPIIKIHFGKKGLSWDFGKVGTCRNWGPRALSSGLELGLCMGLSLQLELWLGGLCVGRGVSEGWWQPSWRRRRGRVWKTKMTNNLERRKR